MTKKKGVRPNLRAGRGVAKGTKVFRFSSSSPGRRRRTGRSCPDLPDFPRRGCPSGTCRTGHAGSAARPQRPAVAALRQPEIRPRQLAHRTRRQLCGRLALSKTRPADGDHPGIRQLAARARSRRRRGLGQPVAAFGPPHGDRRALAEGQGREDRPVCPIPMPMRGRWRSSSPASSARSAVATANGAR